jgi:hypothetical protein
MRGVAFLLVSAKYARLQPGFKVGATVADAGTNLDKRQVVAFGSSPDSERLGLKSEVGRCLVACKKLRCGAGNSGHGENLYW